MFPDAAPRENFLSRHRRVVETTARRGSYHFDGRYLLAASAELRIVLHPCHCRGYVILAVALFQNER